MATASVQTESIAQVTPATPRDSINNLSKFNRQEQDRNSSTDSQSTQPDNVDDKPLDFQKRDITGSSKNKLFSQLSSLSLHSLNSQAEIVQANNRAKFDHDDPIVTIDDRERISSPASTAALLASGQPAKLQTNNENFDNFREFKSNSLKAEGVLNKEPKLNSVADLPRFTRNASLPELDLRHIQRFSKHYEPARAVLHRSELQSNNNSEVLPHSQGTASSNSQSSLHPNSHPQSTLTGRMSPSISQHFAQPVTPAQAQINQLYLSLGSSPDSISNTAPLRQIRDLKQPLYVPAVLRPTESAAYQHSNPLVSVGRARQPATKHWVRDNTASDCHSCGLPFTWFRRRHHCRKCGDVFCATDANNIIGLDHALNFNLLGQPCRACDSCANEFKLIAQDAPLIESTEQDIEQNESSSEWF